METAEVKQVFAALNDRFDHVYVLTLKRSGTRHERLRQMLDGLDYEIFWGVDGAQLSVPELVAEGVYDPEAAGDMFVFGRELVPGELGCALSHLRIYEDILRRGFEKALILEDDVVVNDIDHKRLCDAIDELPAGWDLLYLGYGQNNDAISWPIALRIYLAYPVLRVMGLRRYDARRLRCMYPRQYSRYLDLAGYHYGTHAYAVSSAGAEKLHSAQTPVSMPPDNAIATMCAQESIRAFRVKHQVFGQDRSLDPTIEGRPNHRQQATAG